MSFAEVWKLAPRKVAKKSAEKAYLRLLKAGISEETIIKSLETMILTEWKGREPRYVPYLASFLNRETFEERPESLEDERDIPLGQHLCTVCKPAHTWQEEGDWRFFEDMYRWACPGEREAMRQAIAKGLRK